MTHETRVIDVADTSGVMPLHERWSSGLRCCLAHMLQELAVLGGLLTRTCHSPERSTGTGSSRLTSRERITSFASKTVSCRQAELPPPSGLQVKLLGVPDRALSPHDTRASVKRLASCQVWLVKLIMIFFVSERRWKLEVLKAATISALLSKASSGAGPTGMVSLLGSSQCKPQDNGKGDQSSRRW